MIATAKLPGPSDFSPASSPATPMISQRGDGRAKCVGLDRETGRDQRRAGAAHGGDLGHQRMAVCDRGNALAVGDEVGFAR